MGLSGSMLLTMPGLQGRTQEDSGKPHFLHSEVQVNQG